MDEQFRQQGAFSWCELMTTDVEAAKAFYTRLFGWQFDTMATPHMTYNIIKVRGSGIGGIMPMPPDAPKGMPPMWGSYVTVDDVDATARSAQELGGRLIVPPTDIPDVGRFCVLQDPQGAVISAITYKMK